MNLYGRMFDSMVAWYARDGGPVRCHYFSAGTIVTQCMIANVATIAMLISALGGSINGAKLPTKWLIVLFACLWLVNVLLAMARFRDVKSRESQSFGAVPSIRPAVSYVVGSGVLLVASFAVWLLAQP